MTSPAFEPTSSFCYNFARYVVLPEIEQLPEVRSGAPFRMVDHVKEIINQRLTPEQQAATYIARDSEKTKIVANEIKFYASFVARRVEMFVDLGQGMFRIMGSEDIDEDALDEELLEAGDEDTGEKRGWIYAFSFPSIVKGDARFPIKVGKTLKDVEARILEQCKGSATFENPIILGRWEVKQVGPTELAIHNTLKARGQWREDVPGKEWFNATAAEVEAILKFIVQA